MQNISTNNDMQLEKNTQAESLITTLSRASERAFRCETGIAGLGIVTRSDRPEISDFQCNDALKISKRINKTPIELASKIAQSLENTLGNLADVTVVKPGFINFVIKNEWLLKNAHNFLTHPTFGFEPYGEDKHVILDYGGANVAKALHVGHLRSAVIGQALNNIFRFAGFKVSSDIHLGDWGLQMGQLIEEIKCRKPELSYFDNKISDCTSYANEPLFTMADLLEWYPVASQKSKNEPKFRQAARRATQKLQSGDRGYIALWKQMTQVSIKDIKRDYDRLGVKFDYWFGESRYQEHLDTLIDRLLQNNVAEYSDGAVVIKVSNDNSMPPAIIRNSNNGYGYAATDLATIDERTSQFEADMILYVVDRRQSLHFKQVFLAAHKANLDKKALIKHLGFGTVNDVDGKPFKTREGGAMRLSDLIDTLVEHALSHLMHSKTLSNDCSEMKTRTAEIIGLSAVKYADLQHDRESDYIFNIEKFSKFEGKTGPYLLYAYVRCKTLIDKGQLNALHPAECLLEISAKARNILLEVENFPNIIVKTLDLGKPHILAEHTYRVAVAFNNFYGNTQVLNKGNPDQSSSNLLIVKSIKRHLLECLSLLGIDVPEKM